MSIPFVRVYDDDDDGGDNADGDDDDGSFPRVLTRGKPDFFKMLVFFYIINADMPN